MIVLSKFRGGLVCLFLRGFRRFVMELEYVELAWFAADCKVAFEGFEDWYLSGEIKSN